jgi:hypothetical protein
VISPLENVPLGFSNFHRYPLKGLYFSSRAMTYLRKMVYEALTLVQAIDLQHSFKEIRKCKTS